MALTSRKLQLIYFPIILHAVLFIVLYTFCNWLFLVKLNVFPIKEDIINVFLPLILPWIQILIWIRPRIRLLILNGGNDRLPSLYYLAVAFAMAVPTIVAQNYMEKATGTLTHLETINQVDSNHPSKYYTLHHFYIDRTNYGVYPCCELTGSHNHDLKMNVYYVFPVLQSPVDTTKSECKGWMGIHFSRIISNDVNDSEKDAEWKQFVMQSQSDIREKNLSRFQYLEQSGHTDDNDRYKKAVDFNARYPIKNYLILQPKDEPFESRTGNGKGWIFGSFAIASVILFIMILLPAIDESKIRLFTKGELDKDDDLKEFIDFFKPRQGFFITPLLIYANTLVFLLMVIAGLGLISFNASDLINWGANYGPDTTDGQWWRLLTSTFLHGGIMHLVANMYGLMFIGIFLEPVLGKTVYLLAYLITGMLASVTSLLWHDATVSVGASGAIFGLYGVFLALLLTKVFDARFTKAFMLSTLFFVGFNLVMGLSGGIDNAAYVGGLISGVILGLLIRLIMEIQRETEGN